VVGDGEGAGGGDGGSAVITYSAASCTL
jgi:hypothetical protein